MIAIGEKCEIGNALSIFRAYENIIKIKQKNIIFGAYRKDQKINGKTELYRHNKRFWHYKINYDF